MRALGFIVRSEVLKLYLRPGRIKSKTQRPSRVLVPIGNLRRAVRGALATEYPVVDVSPSGLKHKTGYIAFRLLKHQQLVGSEVLFALFLSTISQ